MSEHTHTNHPFIPKVIKDDGDDKGKFIFETWGSVEVMDKDGQILPVGEIMKAMPSMLRRGGVIHLGHTNRVVGRIMDFWKSDWVDPEDTNRKIPGIQFKAELFDDYKSDIEAREGVRNGKYRMVSFGGMSWKGDHMEGPKGAAEVMKDLEGWEFALVERGKNPLAYMTNINGVSIAKGDDETPFTELVKDQRFNNILMSHLMDGVRYSEAVNMAKTAYFGKKDDKEIQKGKQIRKSDKMTGEQAEKQPEGEFITLEDFENLVKGYEELSDAVKELKGMIGEMAEGMLVLTKEMVYPDDLQNFKITKGEEKKDDEDEEPFDPKAFGKMIAKELVEELANQGFTKAGTPGPRSEEGGKQLKKEEPTGVTEPDFDKMYEGYVQRKLNKGIDEKEQFSFLSEGMKTMGVDPEKKE